MAQRKRRDGINEAPVPAHQQQQPHDKQKVIGPCPDMLGAEPGVVEGHRAGRAFLGHHKVRLGGGKHSLMKNIVSQGDAKQRRGLVLPQARDRHGLPDQAHRAFKLNLLELSRALLNPG